MLGGGTTVTTISRVRDFDINVLPTQPTNVLVDGFSECSEVIENLHAVYWSQPQAGEALQMVEIGGVKLQRNK